MRTLHVLIALIVVLIFVAAVYLVWHNPSWDHSIQSPHFFLLCGWLVLPGLVAVGYTVQENSLGKVIMIVWRGSHHGLILSALCLPLLLWVVSQYGNEEFLAGAGDGAMTWIAIWGFIWALGIGVMVGFVPFGRFRVRESGIGGWRWDEIEGYVWSPDRNRKSLIFVLKKREEPNQVRLNTRLEDYDRLNPILERKLPGRRLSSLSPSR